METMGNTLLLAKPHFHKILWFILCEIFLYLIRLLYRILWYKLKAELRGRWVLKITFFPFDYIER
jgi:hypothetical protein